MEELSLQDEIRLEKNLVWIFADRRSGTTWLANELLSYKTKLLDEPLLGLHLGILVEREKLFTRTYERQKKRQNYFFSSEHKDIWKFYLRKLILNRINDQFKTLSEKIIIKEPTGSIGADFIAKCTPNSKIIVVLRDGRDIIDSKIDESKPGAWELKEKGEGTSDPRAITEEKRLYFVKRYSKMWVLVMKILMNSYIEHPKELRYLVRYEDLLTHTVFELKKIYQFLGIKIEEVKIQEIVDRYSFDKIPESEKGKGEFRRFATPGKWKENLSKKEQEKMNEIIKDTLTELGY